jgi:3-methyl-2-oxobutanoate hydroxymethyltransferase
MNLTQHTIQSLQQRKTHQEKISMLTCYDSTFAWLVEQSHIDIILVGDSGSMTLMGYPDTTHATIDMMVSMTGAVRRGASKKFIVADLPFLAHRQGIQHAIQCVDNLVKAGANAIKIEGLDGHAHIIADIIESGVPVMGHLGLTPQSVHSLGYRVQGKAPEQADRIMNQALQLESLGCFALVLECVPSPVAAEIAQQLKIPVIGIGAGAEVDGQVLVLQDMLGMNPTFKPKFVRHFLDGAQQMLGAFNQFHEQVQSQNYPTTEESYHLESNKAP